MTEPDDLTRAREELGEPDAVYQVGAAWFRTKLVLGLVLIAVGFAGCTVLFATGFKALHVLLHFILWPLGVGVGLIVNLVKQRGLVVLVYPTGLLRLRRGEVESFPWAELTEVRLKTARAEKVVVVRDAGGDPTACWLPVEVPTVMLWNTGITVVRADGTTAEFTPVLAGFAELAEEVQRRSFPHLWAAAAGRLREGRAVAFGKLEANAAGLFHGGKVLPWGKLGKLSVGQGQLSIEEKGKWLPWATVKPVAEVANPHVLFALADVAGSA